MAELKYSLQLRGRIRTKVTKLHDEITASLFTLSESDKRTSLASVESWKNELLKLNERIGSSMFESNASADAMEKEWEACEKYELKVIQTSTLLGTSLPQPSSPVAAAPSSPRLSKLKLPEIPLPTFSNAKDENLSEFVTNLEDVINKYALSEGEKYVFLKKQLSGDPLTLVSSLSGSDRSYAKAKGLLGEAFADIPTQQFGVIRRLADLKFMDTDPYAYISEMRQIQDLFKTLKIQSEQILQYFLWNSMPTNLRLQFVNMCNCEKPDLQSINLHIFKAVERCKEFHKKSDIRPLGRDITETPLSGFAADVKPSFNNSQNSTRYFCSLCSSQTEKDFSHTTKECTKYDNPNSKVNRLKEIGACIKCGYANHTYKSCNSKLKKCFHCSKYHMSFLCLSSDKAKQKSVSSGIVLAGHTYQVDVGETAILPTFQCQIRGRVVRGMKDSGCQPNFILESLARDLDLPEISKKIKVTINGFNECKEYITKVVAVELNISNVNHTIHAICIPNINTDIALPGLTNIARVFKSKGYRLADGSLVEGDGISGLQLILGMTNPEVLLETQVSFGGPVPSVFSNTKLGVMFSGCLGRLRSNLEHLPSVTGKPPHTKRRVSPETHPQVHKESAETRKVSVNHIVLTTKNRLNEKVLQNAMEETLEEECNRSLGYDTEEFRENTTETNDKLTDYVLENTQRLENGRLRVPLTWREDVAKHLGKNLQLAKVILRSQKKTPMEKLIQMDKAIKELETCDVIEKIPNLDEFLKTTPNHSFLPHMGVFRPDHETTKCRIVFLSNLCGRDETGSISLSHNQAIHPGPCLNQKITTALIQLRFDSHIVTYDLRRAFLQLSLYEEDSNKLLFLWFRDVINKDFSIVAYRNLRLSFGLRCSPSLLMLALYRILCVDSDEDSVEDRELKRLLYALIYMDNGAYTGGREEVQQVYGKLNNIFNPYKFQTQQLCTNNEILQAKIDSDQESDTPDSVKLLGLNWDRVEDKLSPQKIELNSNADTKRLVLQSVASQYDPFNIQGPCLNRARLFLHSLQTSQRGWDTVLDGSELKEWKTIVKQVNKSIAPKIPRSMGARKDSYELVMFTDASRHIYAAVAYLKNEETNEVSFLAGKNKLLNKQLELKTIPTLELQAITLGVEKMVELYEELAGPSCVCPLKITKRTLYTDSSISIHWLGSQAVNYEKMQTKTVFVRNRLEYIERKCKDFPITFRFVATNDNPADCLTRCLSPSMLEKSCFHTGPSFLRDKNYVSDLSVSIPKLSLPTLESGHTEVKAAEIKIKEDLITLENYSNIQKPIRVLSMVLKFVRNMKKSIQKIVDDNENLKEQAWKLILIQEQRKQFEEIHKFLAGKSCPKKSIPSLVSRLNLFIDDGIIKLKSKFGRWLGIRKFCFPILLCSKSYILKLIIRDTHETFAHAGCYTVLMELKKRFWFDKAFSTVKQILKQCQICKRFNNRKIKLNQNSYRDFRTNPSPIPFQHVFMDHLGPFHVGVGNERRKVWLLLVTCLWSRAVQLHVCHDMTVRSFLLAFQTQVLREGTCRCVYTDLGSQLVAGSKTIRDFVGREEAKNYLKENGIDSFTFDHYAKGNSTLGSLVESCVKLVKRLIYGAIHNHVLNLNDFYFVIEQVQHIVNKRPISFKEALRDNDGDNLPTAITPELLTKGRELLALNVVPELEPADDDPEWTPDNSPDKMWEEMKQIRNIRKKLGQIYDQQFQNYLIDMATNSKTKYLPVSHTPLEVGDIVLISDPMLKTNNFPLARVLSLETNNLGETTVAILQKGGTREKVKRHVSSLIPYFRPASQTVRKAETLKTNNEPKQKPSRPLRRAAVESRRKTALIS